MDKPSLLYPPIPVGHGLSKQFKTKTRITRTINQKNKRYENQRTPPTASILPPHATPLKKKKKNCSFSLPRASLEKKIKNKIKLTRPIRKELKLYWPMFRPQQAFSSPITYPSPLYFLPMDRLNSPPSSFAQSHTHGP
jgi:hypothetical protein